MLAVDVSGDMTPYWSWTRDALYRLIGQLLPLGTQLSIVTVGQEGAKVVVHSALVKESNRQGLHGRIPFRSAHRDSILFCWLIVLLLIVLAYQCFFLVF